MELRFFDVAFSELIPQVDETIETMSTDGNCIFFKPEHMIAFLRKTLNTLTGFFCIVFCIAFSVTCGLEVREIYLYGALRVILLSSTL